MKNAGLSVTSFGTHSTALEPDVAMGPDSRTAPLSPSLDLQTKQTMTSAAGYVVSQE